MTEGAEGVASLARGSQGLPTSPAHAWGCSAAGSALHNNMGARSTAPELNGYPFRPKEQHDLTAPRRPRSEARRCSLDRVPMRRRRAYGRARHQKVGLRLGSLRGSPSGEEANRSAQAVSGERRAVAARVSGAPVSTAFASHRCSGVIYGIPTVASKNTSCSFAREGGVRLGEGRRHPRAGRRIFQAPRLLASDAPELRSLLLPKSRVHGTGDGLGQWPELLGSLLVRQLAFVQGDSDGLAVQAPSG